MSFFKSKDTSRSLETADFNPKVLDRICTEAAKEIEEKLKAKREAIYQNRLQELKANMIEAAHNGKAGKRFSLFDSDFPECRWTTIENLKELFPSFRIEKDKAEYSSDTDLIIFWG